MDHGLPDDVGDGGMSCNEHPFKNNTPAGGICAFCLQDKLGKLVSSSFPIAVFPSSSSSSPPRSFRSVSNGGTSSTTITTTITTTTTVSNGVLPVNPECHYHRYYENNNNGYGKSGIRNLLGRKKKKNEDVIGDKNVVFTRSKSTVTPRRNGAGGAGGGGGLRCMDSDNGDGLTGRNKRGFWSFLYLQKHGSKKVVGDISSNSLCASFPSQIQRSGNTIVVEENDSPCHATFDRKVSRSRSVGCGSRSFSGDFFERISTGFGDCTLRRVESQREGKSKVSSLRAATGGQDCIKERVRCGGLFSGFMITSSSSSSSSSSYWVSSNPNTNNNESGNHNHHPTGKMTSASVRLSHQHSRSRSWGWALASPMRAFKSSSNKKEAQNKNQTPNLSAIPSLLSVRS